jgi:nicotinate-nucleotide pyrophosphorylase (carboxylating)
MWHDTPTLRALIELALAEDLGNGGDLTTLATVPADRRGTARVVAKAPLVLAGLPVFDQVVARVDAQVERVAVATEGQVLAAGDEVVVLTGPVRSILTAERTALNFLGRLSGIASLTARYVAATAGHRAQIIDTRKTLPAFRALDKYAVRVGGGANHRTALDAGVLIKENHVLSAGSVGAAIEACRHVGSHLVKVEVEVESLDELAAAVAAGAESAMLDNFSLADMRAAVARFGDQIVLEASGNMTLERIADVAATGVHLISVGALTHSVPVADLSLRLDPL